VPEVALFPLDRSRLRLKLDSFDHFFIRLTKSNRWGGISIWPPYLKKVTQRAFGGEESESEVRSEKSQDRFMFPRNDIMSHNIRSRSEKLNFIIFEIWLQIRIPHQRLLLANRMKKWWKLSNLSRSRLRFFPIPIPTISENWNWWNWNWCMLASEWIASDAKRRFNALSSLMARLSWWQEVRGSTPAKELSFFRSLVIPSRCYSSVVWVWVIPSSHIWQCIPSFLDVFRTGWSRSSRNFISIA
jgi:hypothetical protein